MLVESKWQLQNFQVRHVRSNVEDISDDGPAVTLRQIEFLERITGVDRRQHVATNNIELANGPPPFLRSKCDLLEGQPWRGKMSK
jgi:hypothetical protein